MVTPHPADAHETADEPLERPAASAPRGRAHPAFGTLLTIVEQIMAESAEPHVARAFDAAAWLEAWLATPTIVLGGRTPVDVATTPDGLDLVRRVLLSQQSGAYW